MQVQFSYPLIADLTMYPSAIISTDHPVGCFRLFETSDPQYTLALSFMVHNTLPLHVLTMAAVGDP